MAPQRPVMSVALIVSLLLASPIAAFQPSPYLQAPSSLDDCVQMAANHLGRWKQMYGMCFTMFLRNKGSKPLLPYKTTKAEDPFTSPGGLLMTSNARYQDESDVDAGVTSVYSALKRSLGGDSFQQHDTSSEAKSQNRMDEDFSDDGSERVRKEPTAPEKRDWPIYRQSVMRTRRQHSLSINSALVSLADMLMAKDFNKEKARQRLFRQQLLGLGR